MNPSFEMPVLPSGGYQYNPTAAGIGWTFSSNSGIQRNDSPWNAPAAPDGVQTAFIQTTSTISQALSLNAGSYTLTFKVAQRSGQLQPIRVSVDGTQVGSLVSPASISFALVSLPFSVASTGTHTLTFSGTDASGDKSTFIDAVTLTSTSVVATTTALVSSLNPLTAGTNVTFTATVTGSAPTGTVGFTDGGSAISGCAAVALPSGTANSKTASCSTASLAAGTHSIVASYGGDATNNGSTSTALSQVVNSVAPPSALVNPSFEIPVLSSGGYQYNPTAAGIGWTFSSNSGIQRNDSPWNAPAAPDGVQTAFIQTTSTISQALSLNAGSYTLTFKVAQRSGQLQPIRVSVDGTQVGSLVSPASITFALVSLPFSVASTGTHTLTFSGTDANGDKSTFIDAVTLSSGSVVATTTTTLASSLNPSTTGTNVAFTATVNGSAPTGTVAFTADGTTLSGCGAVALPSGTANSKTASCGTASLAAGTHSIVARYGGDAANSGSTSVTLSQVVNATSDSQAPSVGISSPAPGSTVKGVVSVTVSATDNVGVAKVNLLANGTLVASSTTAPYTFSWDSTKVADGTATLMATAYDAANNSASASINVTVQNAVVTAGATYYVSSSSGSDANAGTQSAPWKTLAKVYSSRLLFKPGDSILLKRGDTWVEVFNIPNQAGVSGTPITYGAYGSGALPTVDAQHLRTFAIYMDSGSHIVVRDLSAINATADGVRIVAAGGNISDVVVQGVLSAQNARFGFSVEATPGVTDVDALEYRDDTANLNGWAGFYAYHVSAGATGINYYGCKASYNAQTSANHGFSAYIANNIHYHGVEAAFTNIDPATGLPNAYASSGSEGHGIALDDFVDNSSVEHSYSHGNAGAGLLLSHESSNNSASYNVIANNGTLGVVINGNAAGSSNIAVVNNTIYGNSYAGIAAWTLVTGLTIENNIVVNNATYGLAFTSAGITNYTVATNLIFGNTLGATNGYVSGATGTIPADPLLVAPASGNFSLQASSPAINAGLTLGSPYQLGLAKGSVWPSAVLLLDQGVSPPWEIGAFVYAP